MLFGILYISAIDINEMRFINKLYYTVKWWYQRRSDSYDYISVPEIYPLYHELGRPTKLGYKIQSIEQTTHMAVYELIRIHHAKYTIWNFYTFAFHHFKEPWEKTYPEYTK